MRVVYFIVLGSLLILGYLSFHVTPAIEAFMSSFFSGFLATLLAVVLGLPVAYKINQHAIDSADKSAKKQNIESLGNALQTLVIAMEGNTELLREYYENALKTETPSWGTLIDSSAWEAVRDDINAELTPANFRRGLAHYFKLVKDFEMLNAYYYDLIFKADGSPNHKSNLRRTNWMLLQLHHYLVTEAPDLIITAKRVMKNHGES